MTKSRDKEINDILERAENYRNELKENQFKIYKIEDEKENSELGKLFEQFFLGHTEENEKKINDKNNVFINYKLLKEEALKGCKKIVKYKYIDKKCKKVNEKLKVRFPKGLQEGTKIIIDKCGNYIKDEDDYSNLIITIKEK